jgi:hypothetical protein
MIPKVSLEGCYHPAEVTEQDIVPLLSVSRDAPGAPLLHTVRKKEEKHADRNN